MPPSITHSYLYYTHRCFSRRLPYVAGSPRRRSLFPPYLSHSSGPCTACSRSSFSLGETPPATPLHGSASHRIDTRRRSQPRSPPFFVSRPTWECPLITGVCLHRKPPVARRDSTAAPLREFFHRRARFGSAQSNDTAHGPPSLRVGRLNSGGPTTISAIRCRILSHHNWPAPSASLRDCLHGLVVRVVDEQPPKAKFFALVVILFNSILLRLGQ